MILLSVIRIAVVRLSHLILHLAILSQLFLYLLFAHRRRNLKIQITCMRLVCGWLTIVACFQMKLDDVARIQIQRLQAEVPRTSPAFGESLFKFIQKNFGRLNQFPVDCVVQLDITQQKVRIFRFHKQWYNRVCCNLQVAHGVNQFQYRRLVSPNIDRINSGFRILLPLGISDLNAVELWKRIVVSMSQFPVDRQLRAVDRHLKFFAAHGKRGIVGHLQHGVADRFTAFGQHRQSRVLPGFDGSSKICPFGQIHVVGIHVMNLCDASCWRLFYGDGINLRRRVTSLYAVCHILSNSPISITDHENPKPMFVVGCSHRQWFVHKSLIGR